MMHDLGHLLLVADIATMAAMLLLCGLSLAHRISEAATTEWLWWLMVALAAEQLLYAFFGPVWYRIVSAVLITFVILPVQAWARRVSSLVRAADNLVESDPSTVEYLVEDADVPGWLHRCRPVVRMFSSAGVLAMEQCACGATRFDGRHWMCRNFIRKAWVRR